MSRPISDARATVNSLDEPQYGYTLTDKPGDVVGPLDQDTALLRMAGIQQPTQLMVRHDEHSPWVEADEPREAYVYMPISRDYWEDVLDAREIIRGQMREMLAEKVRAAGFLPDGETREVAEPLSDPTTMLVKLSVPVKRPEKAADLAPEPKYGQLLRHWNDCRACAGPYRSPELPKPRITRNLQWQIGMPSTRSPVGGFRMSGGGSVQDIEIPPSGLVDVELAARIAGVKPGTIRVWCHRRHLDVARDIDGRPLLNEAGHYLYDYMAVINAEYATRARARRPVPYVA